MEYSRRYEGIRWKLVFGSYDGVEQFAVNQAQRCLQKYLPYVMHTEKVKLNAAKDQDNLVLIGTPDDNPLLDQLIKNKQLMSPLGPQGYTLACIDSPWLAGRKIIAAAGFDPEAVWYAVQELAAWQLSRHILVDHPAKLREALDAIQPFSVSERPLVANRGIWTWGYVIYDYRRFLDNMARLRMNMLTVWNDCPPINAREFIDYAHSRGIKVIMGFHWGWGIDDLNPNSDQDLAKTKTQVIANYTQNYQNLGIDGIYFQTFTETHQTQIDGNSIAALACKWVNEIAAGLYEIDPDLYIQFGLHATSIKDNYTEFKALDPRVTITWEDAGAMPYSYHPTDDLRTLGLDIPDFPMTIEQTLAYSKKLVGFRDNREFAIVPKGYNALRWDTDFEHHQDFIIGERDPEWIKQRGCERRARWECIDRLWLKYNPFAAAFYRGILECSPSKITATALVEDGMFEEYTPISVNLFAETVWNPNRTDQELLQRACTLTKTC